MNGIECLNPFSDASIEEKNGIGTRDRIGEKLGKGSRIWKSLRFRVFRLETIHLARFGGPTEDRVEPGLGPDRTGSRKNPINFHII